MPFSSRRPLSIRRSHASPKERRTRRLQLRRAGFFESLEERRLLALANLVSGRLEISGASGVDETLFVSSDGTNLRIHDPSHPVTAGSGLVQVDANTATLPVSSLTGQLSIDLGSGQDVLTFQGTRLIAAPGGISADAESITVAAGVTLSTRAATGDPVTGVSTANSGNLTLSGDSITVSTGARLLSHVQAGSPRGCSKMMPERYASGDLGLLVVFSSGCLGRKSSPRNTVRKCPAGQKQARQFAATLLTWPHGLETDH